ncbi:hypothetical protein [uncultured Planococcus sp.]|uniref:hypothetical protein n=1 Tax=uncultured Planococcus sp. TaxID=337815 RepID=UPI0026311FCA|nr:hypothetical protein [uncultured Planococcus sp.]
MDNIKLEKALQHAGINSAEYLGEGAWHYAWKVSRAGIDLVLRIPKASAYGKQVPFDEETLKADYGGTELYYRTVNKAVAGAAPSFFQYHVSPELTYTLESFGGEKIDLHKLTDGEAYRIGREIGYIHRKTEEIPHGLEGFGYLKWSQTQGLQGSLSGSAEAFLIEESEEHLADYQALSAVLPEFEDKTLGEAIRMSVELRKQTFTKTLLVNQDVSPENILMNDNRVVVIDPFPSVYYPRGMAGNFMNLYETFFVALADTDRYKQHDFSAVAHILRMIGNGFLEGYSEGDAHIANQVRGEQLLQLLETANIHHQLLSEDMTEGIRIRYGTKQQIENRLMLLSKELKRLGASEAGNLAKSVQSAYRE